MTPAFRDIEPQATRDLTAEDLQPLCPPIQLIPEPELSLVHHFDRLVDPRTTRTCQHRLIDVVVIALCAVIGGADTWDAIALFGRSKKDWFARFLELPNGIPSHDTFNRVFAALDPVAFQECFVSWMNA